MIRRRSANTSSPSHSAVSRYPRARSTSTSDPPRRPRSRRTARDSRAESWDNPPRLLWRPMAKPEHLVSLLSYVLQSVNQSCSHFSAATVRFQPSARKGFLYTLGWKWCDLYSHVCHWSLDSCLEVRDEIVRTLLCCIAYWSCAQSLADLDEWFLQLSRLGFVSLGPFHWV